MHGQVSGPLAFMPLRDADAFSSHLVCSLIPGPLGRRVPYMILTSLGYESKSRTMANSRECAKLTLLCPPWRGPVVRHAKITAPAGRALRNRNATHSKFDIASRASKSTEFTAGAQLTSTAEISACTQAGACCPAASSGTHGVCPQERVHR